MARTAARSLGLVLGCLVMSSSALLAFLPSPTSPYGYSTPVSDFDQHYKVGDGFFHDNGCSPGGPPNYTCGCAIGAPGRLTRPQLTLNGTNLDLEYWILNAYCNPSADGGDPNRPNSQNYYIYWYTVDQNDALSGPFHITAPYWEHGKVTLTANSCARYQAVLVINYFGGCPGGICYEYASSNIVGPMGQEASGRACLADTRSCPVPIAAGQPINVGSGNMHYEEPLFSVAENASPLAFSLAYNSRVTTGGPLGVGFTHSFASTIKGITGSTKLIQLTNGKGEKSIYYTADTVSYYPVWPADAHGSVVYSSGASTFTLTDLDGTATVFRATDGVWLSTTDRWGNAVTGSTPGSNLTSITDAEGRVWTLAYSGSQLVSITDPSSNLWQFGYDGSGRLTKVADPFHNLTTPWRTYVYVTGNTSEPMVITTVADDAGKILEGHQYDSAGRATSSWEGDTSGSPPAPGPNARSLVNLVYTSGTQTTVTTRIDSTPTNLTSIFTFGAPVGGRFLPLTIDGNCPSCGGGGDDYQSFTWDGANNMLTKVVGVGAEQVQTNYSYDSNGMVLTRTEAVGKTEERTTTYAYGYVSPTGLAWPSFVTSITEPSAAKGVGYNKVTTNSWNTTGTSETTLTTQVTGFLKSTDTADTTYVTTTLFDTKHRVTEVDGPLPTARTTYEYYADNDSTSLRRGRLKTQALYTSSLNHLDTTYDSYDIFGTAKSVKDPNLVETQRTTDAKGRVTSVTSKKPAGDAGEPADYVTSYSFDLRDRLTQVTLPLSNKVQYGYEDGTNRLLDTIRVDSAGNLKERLHLTLNTIGNKTLEEYQLCTAGNCSTWTTKRSESYSYDAHDRLQKNTHTSDSTHIDYTYDSRGNLKTVKDENHGTANTTYTYDFLNRMTKVVQTLTGASSTGGSCTASAGTIATCYGYDAHDNLTSVVDPNTNSTTYAYDDFRRVQTQTSPVSGATNYGYDPGGNLTSSTDANSATTTRTYDWASRLLSAASSKSGLPTETVTYTYDDPTAFKYGKGRLTTMTDPVATTTYAYERRGLMKTEVRTIPGNTYTTSYGYDGNGNRSTIGYPSGRTATYTFDFADRPLSLAATNPSVTYVTAAGTTYHPFGPLLTATYGSTTLAETITYDQRYRPNRIQLTKSGTPQYDFYYAPDAVGNFTSICAASPCASGAFDRNFAYDDLNRLTTANSGSSLWGTASDNKYVYDKMGNITSLKLGASRNVTFTFDGTKPTIATASDTTGNVDYDAAGNETLVGTGNSFTYSARNLLAKGENLAYEYDGRGLRSAVFFSGPTVTSVTPASAVQQTSSYSTSLAIVGTGFVSGATVQIAGLTVNMVTFNSSTSLTVGVTVPAPSATIPSGYRDVIVINPGTNNPSGLLSNGFDLQRFTDAPASDSFAIYEWLATTKNPIILEGFTPIGNSTQFNRNTNIQRRDMARWITRARLETAETCGTNGWCLPSGCSSPQYFGDVNCPSGSPPDADWGWIQKFYDDGITGGCQLSPPLFCPNSNLTRGQMAVFIEKGLNQQPIPVSLCDPSNLRFADVPCTHQFWGYIEKFAQDGITGGCGGNPPNYCPDNPVTRGQMAVFISKGWQYLPPPVPDGLPGRYLLYTPEMNLLAETAIAGSGSHSILYEYLWFNGEPVAQSDGATLGQQHWTFTDHLGTSLRQYDSTGTQYWRAEYEPYGRVFSLLTANQHEPLRLPGQESEELNVSSDGNGSSKRFYNIFRWYRPNWGRYAEIDPAWDPRRTSEINPYLYSAGNPIRFGDPRGLVTWDCSYKFGSVQYPEIGPGAGVLTLDCVSRCACGRMMDVTVRGLAYGGSVGPFPVGIGFSTIVLKDRATCPDRSNLTGPFLYLSAGAVAGGGYSCTTLRFGSAAGSTCSVTLGFDLGGDAYGGKTEVVNSTESCCRLP